MSPHIARIPCTRGATLSIDDIIYHPYKRPLKQEEFQGLRKGNFGRGAAALLAGTSFLFTSAPVLAQAAPQMGSESEDSDRRQSEEIVVTGYTLSTEEKVDPLPVTILSGEALVHRRRSTLGETLDGMPGVHMDNFGAGASRPVIRGQTIPRIEILSDGANLFDASSVSPDHSIVAEPLLLDAIEVQRGPAATRFGGNAMMGAVNLIDSKVPKAIPEGGYTGAVEFRHGTADDEMTLAGRVTAALGSFVLHAEGAKSWRGDYEVPGGHGSDRLKDSFADTSSYAFGASWVTEKGYIGAAYTRQNANYGLPGHSHINGVCHTHGLDLHCEAHDQFDDPFGSPDHHTAYIDLKSDRVDVRGDFEDILPGFSHVRLRGSYTDYRHDEIDGPALFSRYTNEVWDGRLELTHKPLFGFTGTLGVQYTDGTFTGININDAHKAPPTSIAGFVGNPHYLTDNIGVFLSERRSFGAVDVEIAARKDWRSINIPFGEFVITTPSLQRVVDAYDARNGVGAYRRMRETSYRTANPLSKHDPFSVSIGGVWNIGDGYSAALSLARTERAPNVRELYAYGNNLATNSYEVGLSQTRRMSSRLPPSTTDVMETTKSVDLTFRKTGGAVEFEVGLFYQDVDDYIFARLIERETESGVPHNLLVYTAADASFAGIDGQISYNFAPHSRVTLFGDYVDTDLKDDNDNLPRIPPGRIGARYQGTWGGLSGDIEYYRTFNQDQVASYETPTDGYNMVNATIAYRFDMPGGRNLELYARGTNLTNELAYVHTSFVKDQSPLRGRSVALGLRHQF